MNAAYVKGEKELLIYALCAEDISRRLQKKLVRVVPFEEDTCRAEGLEWKLGLCPLIPLDLLLLCTCSLVESISQLRLNCQIRNSNWLWVIILALVSTCFFCVKRAEFRGRTFRMKQNVYQKLVSLRNENAKTCAQVFIAALFQPQTGNHPMSIDVMNG